MSARSEINDLVATAGIIAIIAVPSLLFALAAWLVDRHVRGRDFSLSHRQVTFALISVAVAVLLSLVFLAVPRMGAQIPHTVFGDFAGMLLLGVLALRSVSFVCAPVAATAAAAIEIAHVWWPRKRSNQTMQPTAGR
jgi:hypothetical protein